MEKCVACQFYDRVNSHQAQADARGLQWGQCRRSAPHLHPVNQKSFMIEGVWPHVRDDDWCGEWKAARRTDARPLNDFASAGPLSRGDGIPGTARPAAGSLMPATRPFGSNAPSSPAGHPAAKPAGTPSMSPAASSGASVSQLNIHAGVTPAAASALGGFRSTGRGD